MPIATRVLDRSTKKQTDLLLLLSYYSHFLYGFIKIEIEFPIRVSRLMAAHVTVPRLCKIQAFYLYLYQHFMMYYSYNTILYLYRYIFKQNK